MARTIKEKVLEALAQLRNISPKDIEAAIALHKRKGISLERAFIEKGLIDEEDFLGILVRELNIPTINLTKYKIDPAFKDLIPERVARQYHLIPVSKIGNTITIALADPFDIFAIDYLRILTKANIDVVLSESAKIAAALDEYYGVRDAKTIGEITRDIQEEEFKIIDQKNTQGFGDLDVSESAAAPIVRMVDLIIKEALKQRASDIHIEPEEQDARVRYRVDGALHEVLSIPKTNQNSVIVRMKIMGGIDITESQAPQDGRFKMRIGAQEIDFRVSLLPTTFGQKVVLRVLDKSNLSMGLDGLSFSPKPAQKLKDAVERPFGMILVTGPTGSGKSTTLYSIVNQLNTPEKNIITIEDPVEYLVDGLTQIPARPEIGLTFASGLRATLRQSPDIVMLGEIRDTETADIAIKAALTGQLVLSTLHTNDAAGALTRLVDMGVEPFLVASSVIVICAQRLCRTICPRCKEPTDIPEEILKNFKTKVKPGAKIFTGKGCDYCRQTGYYGRVGIIEVLEVDEPIREMLIKGTSSSTIKEYAMKKGMSTLWDDAVEKLLEGKTTAEEVLRITSEDTE